MRYQFDDIPILYRGKPVADLIGEADIDIGDPGSDAHVDTIWIFSDTGTGENAKREEIEIVFSEDEKFFKYLEREILSRAARQIEDERFNSFGNIPDRDPNYGRLLPSEMR